MEAALKVIQAIVPISHREVKQGTRAPYATYELSETPIRTKDGIVGYEGVFAVVIFASTLKEASALTDRVVEAIDNKTFGTRKFYYNDTEDEDFPDIGLIGKSLTFNTLE